MLIALVGPSCAGKRCVAKFLQDNHGFIQLCVSTATHASSISSQQSEPAASIQPNATHSRIEFADIAALQAYATEHWQQHHLVLDIDTIPGWTVLRKRPFFLLVAIDAPLMVRYQRCQTRFQSNQLSMFPGDPGISGHSNIQRNKLLDGQPSQQSENRVPLSVSSIESIAGPLLGSASQPPSLEEFIAKDDARIYICAQSLQSSSSSSSSMAEQSQSPSLFQTMSMAHVRILNTLPSVAALESMISKIDLLDPVRLRPNWDAYFMELCDLAAQRSNCMKRRVGCILVSNRRVVATGYNGTPSGVRNCNEGGCARCNGNASCGSQLDTCLCLHAEENALLEVGRDRIRSSGWVVLYCNTCPCLGCAKKIAQVGVHEVVYSEAYGMDSLTAALLKEAGVVLRQHSHLQRLFVPEDLNSTQDPPSSVHLLASEE